MQKKKKIENIFCFAVWREVQHMHDFLTDMLSIVAFIVYSL